MGGQTSDLVELIIRRVNGAVQPDPLIAELERTPWVQGAVEGNVAVSLQVLGCC